MCDLQDGVERRLSAADAGCFGEEAADGVGAEFAVLLELARKRRAREALASDSPGNGFLEIVIRTDIHPQKYTLIVRDFLAEVLGSGCPDDPGPPDELASFDVGFDAVGDEGACLGH